MGCKVLAGCYSEVGLEHLLSLKEKNIVPFRLDVTNQVHSNSSHFHCALTSQDSINRVTQLLERECPSGLWALINNAGIVAGITMELTTMQMFRKVSFCLV
jgi:NAD(P)-dependent dehydrogenase (short-subunit alcohol dehydrogenase family)